MQIFDVHVHVQPAWMAREDSLALLQEELKGDASLVLKDAATFVRHLDESGVEKVCCINYVSPDVMGFTPAVNDWIAEYTKDHRERLLPVGSVHPKTTPDIGAETERILALGIRMIKLHPPHQLFSPNSYRSDLPRIADLYSIAEERGIPIMFHTGTSIFPRARNVFADPMPIDDVAIDFPRLKIIMAHAGRPLYGETALFLARRHRNISIDLSGIPPKALPKYFPRFRDLPEQLLWGTDWPSPGVRSMKKNIDDMRAHGLGEELERKLFWENAERIFAEGASG